MVVIARTTSIDADRLGHAARSIFERRATHAMPRSLESPPPDWANRRRVRAPAAARSAEYPFANEKIPLGRRNPPTRRVSRGADEGTRTLDLLHGKQ
jgi:hypothetical protein